MLVVAFKEVEMQGAGAPSPDQLGVFLTVVETGSFAAAGRRLGRATSAVSYAIATLEQQLGVQLSEQSGGFYSFEAIYRADTPPGPAGAWIIRHFSEHAE